MAEKALLDLMPGSNKVIVFDHIARNAGRVEQEMREAGLTQELSSEAGEGPGLARCRFPLGYGSIKMEPPGDRRF